MAGNMENLSSSPIDLTFPIGPVVTKMYGPYKRGDRILYEKTMDIRCWGEISRENLQLLLHQVCGTSRLVLRIPYLHL